MDRKIINFENLPPVEPENKFYVIECGGLFLQDGLGEFVEFPYCSFYKSEKEAKGNASPADCVKPAWVRLGEGS